MISRIDEISHTTKAPTGLTITRKDNDITFKWKIADKNYGQGQQLQWRVNTGFDELGNYTFKNGSWKSVSITKTATSKTVSVTLNNYRPNTSTSMHSIEFRVRGLRSDYNESRKVKENGKTVTQSVSITCSWSPWVSEKMVLALPRVPSATATFSDTYDNRTTFSWDTSTSNTDNRFFRDVQYQSCLIKDSGSVGAAYDSKFGNTKTGKPASGTVPIAESTEDTTTLAQGSYTRWFRFRARGSKGPSVWKYVKHTYAEPFQAIIEEATLTGNKVYVKWTAPSSSANPIDKTTVKYSISTPNAGMVCPQGASWNEADVSKDTKGTDAARFTIETLPGVDEVLYVKVTTTHDRDDTDSPIEIVQGGIGPLADPTNLSVSTDDATHKAIITATNNSSVPDSFLAIIYRTAQDPESDLIVGVIPHGSSSVTVQCPDWDEVGEFSFGVYAVAGTYTSRGADYGNYEIDANMTSAGTLWQGGAIPVAPTNVTVNATEYAGTVKVAWTWAWSEANEAEISWSEDPLAWESTSEPNTYEVSNMHASQWYISGLETGTTWYIRVRLLKVDGDSRVEGPYSKIVPIDLSSAPSVPVLVLSAPVITVDGEVTASWAYSSTDGTDQAYAEITTAEINASGVYYGRYELSTDSAVVQGKDYFTLSSGIYTHVTPSGTENPASLGWYEVVPNIIAHTETAQHVTINAAEQGWTAGETYNLCVRVVSASGRMSDSWSEPVGVTVAAPLVAAISSSSLVYETYVDTPDMSRDIYVLKAMPLTVTVTGAGEGGTTSVALERAETYQMLRPDETQFNGYKGETVALVSQTGESQITIGLDNLIGRLDDGAAYTLVGTVQDDLGQSAEIRRDFEVHWTHQAAIPTATAEVTDEARIAEITPIAPFGADPTDVCDIYRLSADRPQLIVEGGEFGTTYVDPYPTIGGFGGHRVVLRTANGDYITADNQPAWVDLGEDAGDTFWTRSNIIDFDGNVLECDFNNEIKNTFEKDFQETAYLGGAIQGDWNPIVRRTGSVDATFVLSWDPDTVKKLRALAAYTGICHIRTKDGSSYAADVQVDDNISYNSAGKLVTATLSITRVDPEGYEGMSKADWEEGTS